MAIDLTDDLWYLVFIKTLPDRPCITPHESPQLLTRVCRRWRQIAISSPLLWSSVAFHPSARALTSGILNMFKLWLQRSSSCLLDIDLRNANDTLPWSISIEPGEPELYRGIYDTLICHRTRIRTLLRGFNYLSSENFCNDGFPELEELFVVDPPDGKIRSAPITSLPPKLKSFSTFNTYNHFNPATRWPQLEHLEIWQTDNAFAGLSIDDCLSILSDLPSLRSTGLHISVEDDERQIEKVPTNVTLPHLQKLLISSLQINITRLITSIHTPELEVAGFDGCACPEFYATLPVFFRQCSKTLTFVVLGQISILNVTLLASIAELRSDVNVAMCSSSFDGHATQRLEQVQRANPNSHTLPSHHLSITYTSPDGIWSENDGMGNSEVYHFPARTFRDYAMFNPQPIRSAIEPEQPGSVRVSICKGTASHHCSFTKTYVS